MADELCSHPGCGRPVFVKNPKYGFGPLCNGHYKQLKVALAEGRPLVLKDLRKYGPHEFDVLNIPTTDSYCEWVEVKGQGYGASVTVCMRPKWGKYKYCQSHQRQAWAGESRPIRSYEFQKGKECSHPDCTEPARAKGLCAKHYSQSRNKQRKQEHGQEVSAQA